ncbi:MAG TPA: adenosylmethionine--8-amino-7-oxononanoate transaminase [Legionellaceae bacterium]|nr:adenosylmethionine--8-amino-7-oxononanoate transaminase [Legionellaceae bacterium]
MANDAELIVKDLNHVWHPCTIMKNLEQHPPLIIKRAKGAYIETDQGLLIDAISSWWCKSLGHGHPGVIAAIQHQLHQFEHVIAANTTHENRVYLAEELQAISQKQHVFFASDGACAIEIAIKLAVQAMSIKDQAHRHQFIALRHAYHGETLGALSVSDLGLYKEAWARLSMPCHFLDIPYVNSIEDPLWRNAESAWKAALPYVDSLKNHVCAIIVEPIIQGGNGLRLYSADFLTRLARYAKQHDIYLIADEIMTGLGRTGEWLAGSYAQIQPDMICLSKGLTSGTIPLSCVLIDHDIYTLFYHQREPQYCFLHSHTHSGNALGIAAALATIRIIREENIIQQARDLGSYMRQCFQEVIQASGQFQNSRHIGAIVAADYSGEHPHFSQALAQAAQKAGALLRPIDNTLYWLPPLNTSRTTIEHLADITHQAIIKIQDKSCIV